MGNEGIQPLLRGLLADSRELAAAIEACNWELALALSKRAASASAKLAQRFALIDELTREGIAAAAVDRALQRQEEGRSK